MDIKKILTLPDKKRRNLTIRRHPVKRHREKRRQFSPEEMLDLLRERACRSWRKWKKSRKPEEPTVHDYRKSFGKWSEAVRQAFGVIDPKIEWTGDYFVKLVIQFDLWTYNSYIFAHKLRPDVVPSYLALRKRWKSYGSLVEVASRTSFEQILGRYMTLWRKLGKRPTLEQCKEDGVQINEAIRLLGSREKLDELTVMMENIYAKQR